jgi:2-dehydro-3-deoxyglucarate aldolase/4-hydroxy-2-oxoheptanedioate aldolase
MIETAGDAARLIDACRYPPQGHRGAAFSVAHDDFLPGEVPSKISHANASVVCSAIVETALGVRNVEEILAVPGLDLVWVGYLDLSLSLGVPGDFSHPKFIEAVHRILDACVAHNLPAAILVNDSSQGLERIKQGFRCLSYSGDIWLLQRALSEGIRAIRSEASEPDPK